MRAGVRARMRVCVYQILASFIRFGQLLHCEHKRIVNIMKVQVELIRFRKKISPSFRFTFSNRGIQRNTYSRFDSRYNISLFDSNHFNYL